MTRILLVLTLLAASSTWAEEGMWTFNNFPSELVAQRYGFTPTQAWLDHLRLSSVRLAGGCSASFVSPAGLVMTNHHCIRTCVEQLSSPRQDYLARGFYARTQDQELRCPNIEANQLLEITDVTARLNAATRGASGPEFNRALKAEMSRIEAECATGPDVRCDVVTLYHGGRYDLYRYRRYQDVRLVFAPEFQIAAFGGYPDNFNFPRFALDCAFLRVYDGGKPIQAQHSLRWSTRGLQEGDLSFVSGHPGGTDRKLTVAQLAHKRDVELPTLMLMRAELRGVLLEFMKRGPEQQRVTKSLLRTVENSLKSMWGGHEALGDPAFFASKAATEQALRKRIDADPELRKRFGGAWEAIEAAMARSRRLWTKQMLMEGGDGFRSDLFGHARTLVRVAAELQKPNEERLREYTGGQLPAIQQRLFRPAPISPELEVVTFTWFLMKLREALGPDDPLVRQILGSKSPDEVARALVRGTRLGDAALRKRLYEGGTQALDASTDPMIRFALLVDPEARATRKRFEDEVEAPIKEHGERVAKAHFAVEGMRTYPDATFTLRLSYGQMKGWVEEDKRMGPLTTFGGAYGRHTGRYPFELPASWLAAKGRVNVDTALVMTTTHDIIGGNSGSPVVDRDSEVVGLIFDGNLPSLGGNYGYDPEKNRALAVTAAGITEALKNIYGATRILEELASSPVPPPRP